VTSKEERAKLEEEILRLTTPSYRAPELVDLYSRKLVSEQVDVWALGCVLYALAFGKHAFGDEGSALAILGGKFTIPTEPYYSQEFKLLFYWLLDCDPNIRPRVGDVVDELDMLLGNRIKATAERRGSGCGSRSSSKSHILVDAAAKATAVPPIPLAARRPVVVTQPNPQQAQNTSAPVTARGAAFVGTPPLPSPTSSTKEAARNSPRGARAGAMESRRNQGSKGASPMVPFGPNSGAPPVHPPVEHPKKPMSNNPFDDILPSINPTFYSTPGMRSTSVAGFPDEFLQAGVGSPFDAPAQTFAHAQSQLSFFNSPSTHTLNGGSSANVAHAASSSNFSATAPSQAPIFYSDPPPQWRTSTGL